METTKLFRVEVHRGLVERYVLLGFPRERERGCEERVVAETERDVKPNGTDARWRNGRRRSSTDG